MNTVVLRQVLEALQGSGISDFILCCKLRTRVYRFLISKSKIIVEIKDSSNDQEMSTEYSKASDVPLEDKLEPTEIKEIRFTTNGLLTKIEKRKIYSEADLLLVLFKVLKENVVFVIKNEDTTRVCYYISSRVMYMKSSYRVLELVETNLFKLYNNLPKARMTMFSSLPRKYSCKDFYTEQNNTATRNGQDFRNGKEGVGVR